MPFTREGYHRLTYAEWLKRDIELARQLFGEDIDTSESTPLGKYIRLSCEDKRDIGEEMEDIYQSFCYLTASGAALRKLCANLGVTISVGSPARHSVTLTGSPGVRIPAGTKVATADKTLVFHTINSVTLAGGSAEAEVECDTRGTVGNVADGAITTTYYSSAVLTGVSGSRLTIPGTDPESDASARRKYEAALSSTGSGTYSAVMAAVYQVQSVTQVQIESNDTMQEQKESGLPAKSFRVSVLADHARANDIAAAIFKSKPFGAKTYGDTSEQVRDRWGGLHEIAFRWMEMVPIEVKLTIYTDGLWTEGSEVAAKDAVAAYINSLPAGRTIYGNGVYTSLKGIPGLVNVDAVEISKRGGRGGQTIALEAHQIAQTDAAHVTITTLASGG